MKNYWNATGVRRRGAKIVETWSSATADVPRPYRSRRCCHSQHRPRRAADNTTVENTGDCECAEADSREGHAHANEREGAGPVSTLLGHCSTGINRIVRKPHPARSAPADPRGARDVSWPWSAGVMGCGRRTTARSRRWRRGSTSPRRTGRPVANAVLADLQARAWHSGWSPRSRRRRGGSPAGKRS